MVIIHNPLLTAFDRVVNLKTIHAAATELGLTQAAVTKRIKALEDELGVSLFIRSRRGMSLTQEGIALVQFCKVTREAEGDLISKIRAHAHEVSYTVVGPTSFISSRIANSSIPLYSKYPYLRLHLRSEDSANRVEMVKRGEVDFAIVSPKDVPKEMDSKMLKSDRYLLVASSKWQGRALNEILGNERIIDFYESDTTTLKYLQKFHLEMYIKSDRRLFVNENEALIKLILAGIGYGTLTETIANAYLEQGSMVRLNRGLTFDDPLALVWYPRAKRQPHLDDLIRSIK